MNMQLYRLNDDGKSTIGALYIDSKFKCFTLEDTYNEPKIYGKTRIPAGSYAVELRKEGGMVDRYNSKYDFHNGMLWLRNVENFEYVYLHTGNDEDDTDGCILIGRGCNTQGVQTISGSVLAYTEIYPMIAEQIEAGYPVNIEVI